MKLTLQSIDYHRNGIVGYGFYVMVAKVKENGEEERTMLIVRFPKKTDADTGGIMCAVFDIAQLSTTPPDIRFGYNSWRGDRYADWADKCIAEMSDSKGEGAIP